MLQGISILLIDLGGTLYGVVGWYPDALPAVRRLSRTYRLALAANQPAEVRPLIEPELGPYFEKLYLSGEVGLEKPDPAFFRLILAEMGAEPGETAMVGDHPDLDIAPAKQLGIRTIWIRRGDLLLYPETWVEADYTIRSLEELR